MPPFKLWCWRGPLAQDLAAHTPPAATSHRPFTEMLRRAGNRRVLLVSLGKLVPEESGEFAAASTTTSTGFASTVERIGRGGSSGGSATEAWGVSTPYRPLRRAWLEPSGAVAHWGPSDLRVSEF